MPLDLYQKEILQQSQHPANYGQLKNYTHHKEGFNRVCGDHVKLYLKIDNETIKDISFESDSCAIVKASASVMTEIVKHQKFSKVIEIIAEIDEFFQNKRETLDSNLHILTIARAFPSRVSCASLPWHTLDEMIKNI